MLVGFGKSELLKPTLFYFIDRHSNLKAFHGDRGIWSFQCKSKSNRYTYKVDSIHIILKSIQYKLPLFRSKSKLEEIFHIQWKCVRVRSFVPLGWSGSGSDHGASKEPMNPLWSWIHQFLWCTMIRSRWPWITDPDPDHPKGKHLNLRITSDSNRSNVLSSFPRTNNKKLYRHCEDIAFKGHNF